VVFTGDILFINGHPIVWAGPVSNWIKACDRIMEMDVDVIVPGHGPITDKQGVAQVKDYLAYISAEARRHFDTGLSAMEAARAISLDAYASWTDAERMVVNVDTLYREFSNDNSPVDFMGLFGQMAMLAQG
jgi:glyoxylase-like metal-dependent hydrolase (beta-lactamase superfamily II)